MLRYLQRVMSYTIWGRKEVGIIRTDELFMLWAMLSNNLVNTCYYLLDYLASIVVKSNKRAEIVVGGIITFIARKFGVGEDNMINPIEGNNRLNIETFISMNFINPHPPANITYELRLNVPLLFILPNPSWTDTRVEQICCMLVLTHRYMRSIISVKRKVQTCTKMRSTMTMKSVSTIMMKDGHGCKLRFRG